MKPRNRTQLLGIAFVLPTLAFIIVFGFIPIFSSIRYSFSNWDGVSAQRFVGFENYVKAFGDPVNIKAIGNTLKLTLWCIIINLVTGFCLANVLFRMKGLRAKAGKVVLFIPYILSFAAVGVLFSFIYSSTSIGLLNKITALAGMKDFPWLGSETTAMPAVILSHAWKDFGFSLLLYFAALQSLPLSLLESGEIDGATEWQKVFYIKLPYLRPTTQTLAVLGVVRYMLTFTMIMFLTPEGGPNKTTEVVATWFYKQSFKFWEFGYGASLATILAAIVMIVTLILRRVLKAEEA